MKLMFFFFLVSLPGLFPLSHDSFSVKGHLAFTGNPRVCGVLTGLGSQNLEMNCKFFVIDGESLIT